MREATSPAVLRSFPSQAASRPRSLCLPRACGVWTSLPTDLRFWPWTIRGMQAMIPVPYGAFLFLEVPRAVSTFKRMMRPGRPMEMIAYCDRNGLVLSSSDGTESRRLVSMTGHLYGPQFSPRKDEVRFDLQPHLTFDRAALWAVSTQGANPHPLLAGWHTVPDEENGRWTPDGSYFVFQSKGQSGPSLKPPGFCIGIRRSQYN